MSDRPWMGVHVADVLPVQQIGRAVRVNPDVGAIPRGVVVRAVPPVLAVQPFACDDVTRRAPVRKNKKLEQQATC